MLSCCLYGYLSNFLQWVLEVTLLLLEIEQTLEIVNNDLYEVYDSRRHRCIDSKQYGMPITIDEENPLEEKHYYINLF